MVYKLYFASDSPGGLVKKEMVGLQPVSVSEGMEGDPRDASRLTQGAHFEHHWCSMYSSVVVGKEN